MLTKSEQYRENARNCGELADEAKDFPSKNCYRRMQDAWLALAEEQDWLDGVSSKQIENPAVAAARTARSLRNHVSDDHY
jgi:hypothetical protein